MHDRFGTAVVRSQAATFDVVTARTETYAEPGALPDVRPGATIEEDLGRRDFTVNAIALRIADGALAEWPGARADLGAGVLRVLHERSFEDDPTRLLRMARYGARLGFEPDPDTDALAAAATVETVSGGRLGSELRLLLREPQPAALLALERHGLGRAVVHPAFRVDARLVTAALGPVPARRPRRPCGAGDDRSRGAHAARRCRSALDRLEFDAALARDRRQGRGGRRASSATALERAGPRRRRPVADAAAARRPRPSPWPARWARAPRGARGRALADATSATGGWRSPATTSWRRA